jgi:type I restriction enzyme M protein
MLRAELKADINKLWDLFWSNGFSNPITAIEQMSYLIFMKRLDDLDLHNSNYSNYKSILQIKRLHALGGGEKFKPGKNY